MCGVCVAVVKQLVSKNVYISRGRDKSAEEPVEISPGWRRIADSVALLEYERLADDAAAEAAAAAAAEAALCSQIVTKVN